MATNRKAMNVRRDAVWPASPTATPAAIGSSALATSRDVDDEFPPVGSALHYRIGWGPSRHEGHTEVRSSQTGRRIELAIHAWPSAAVRGDRASRAERCTEVMTEHPHRGPLAAVHKPLFDLVVKARNVEALRRLERVALGEASV